MSDRHVEQVRAACQSDVLRTPSDKTQAQQVSYLLLWVGEKGRDIHSTFTFAPGRPAVPATEHVAALLAIPAENRNDLQTVCRKFREYVTPKSNVIFARYKFYNRTQGPSETVDSFMTDVKLLAKDCGFPPEIIDEMIRDRLVYGTNSHKVRERFINRGADLDLSTALNIARAYESAQSQLQKMTGLLTESTQVHMVKTNRSHRGGGKPRSQNRPATSSKQGKPERWSNTSTDELCGNCGLSRHANKVDCPAQGRKCKKCHKQNHFACVCRQKTVHAVTGPWEEPVDEIYFDSLSVDTVEHNSQTQALTELRIGDQDIMCKLDTGAEGNVMPFSTWRKISLRSRKRPDGSWTELKRSSVRMIAYGGSVIRQIGTSTLQVRHKGNEHSCVFYVTDSTGPALISLPSCCELGLVKLQYAIGYTTPHSNQEMRKWILHEYGDVFKGIGRFSGEYHIEVDTSVPPVIHPPR